jgi:hypothetical protein
MEVANNPEIVNTRTSTASTTSYSLATFSAGIAQSVRQMTSGDVTGALGYTPGTGNGNLNGNGVSCSGNYISHANGLATGCSTYSYLSGNGVSASRQLVDATNGLITGAHTLVTSDIIGALGYVPLQSTSAGLVPSFNFTTIPSTDRYSTSGWVQLYIASTTGTANQWETVYVTGSLYQTNATEQPCSLGIFLDGTQIGASGSASQVVNQYVNVSTMAVFQKSSTLRGLEIKMYSPLSSCLAITNYVTLETRTYNQ